MGSSLEHGVVQCLVEHCITGWWFGTCFVISPIVGMMIQSDFHIFFRGVGQPDRIDEQRIIDNDR